MAIKKSSGVTRTERLLAELCERTFLGLWSYPNPFKDDKKELCDLLAVFDNHVFIFFDREGAQLENLEKDSQVSWERWKRTVVDRQINTAHGAEACIRSGRKIFLEKSLATEFPIHFDREKIIVHKIIVAHGAVEACLASSGSNLYGSLGIAYGSEADTPSFPFLLDLDRRRPVHVLDSYNLPIVLSELDTAFDLSSYFDAKIDAISRYDFLIYCGEEDLLAHYFLNFDSDKKRHFIGTKVQDINSVAIGEGEWKGFQQSDVYRRRKLADRDSYLWDTIIQHTSQNALAGKLLGDSSPLRGKSALHEMAREPRFMRRALSSEMIQAVHSFPNNKESVVRHLSFMPSFYKGKAYVFLQFHMSDKGDYEKDYRPKRQALLEIACGAAKDKFPDLKTIVGIAIDAPKFAEINSEDFILMDCAEWPEERRKYYMHANEGIDFFATQNLNSRAVNVKAFPDKPAG